MRVLRFVQQFAFTAALAVLVTAACSGSQNQLDADDPLIQGLSLDPVGLNGLPSQGPVDARVTIIEITDFQCPYCQRGAETMKQLLEYYGDKIRLVVVHMPLQFHKNARPAALASLAAQRQGKFFPYQDLLWANARDLTEENLERFAKEVGLDVNRWKKDYRSPELEVELERHMAIASVLGVRGVPHFRINGKQLVGAQPFGTFKEEIDAQLDSADELIAHGLPRGYVHAKLSAGVDGGVYKRLIFDGEKPGGDLIPPEPQVHRPARVDPVEQTRKALMPVLKKKVNDLNLLPYRAAGLDACISEGPEDAAVTLVEFMDYECPFCRKFEESLQKASEAEGRNLRRVVCQLPLEFHKNARIASKGAYSAWKQGRFFEYHAALLSGAKLSPERVVEGAREVGLDMGLFEIQRFSPEAEEWVVAQEALAKKLNANGTPNSFINGLPYRGARPYDELIEIIEIHKGVVRKLIENGLVPTHSHASIASELATKGYNQAVFGQAELTK